MNPFIRSCLMLVALAACSPAKLEMKKTPYDGNSPLQASKDQIINKLQQDGSFVGVQTSLIDKTYEVVESKSDTQYFIKDNKVVSFIRPPVGDERKLIYWRYQFQGQLFRDQEMENDGQLGHRLPMRQLACDSCNGGSGTPDKLSGSRGPLGVGVLYDPNSESVKRVFYYDNQ